MASFRQRNKVWYIRYVDEHGKQKEEKSGRDKKTAEALARKRETEVSQIKAGLEVRERIKSIAEWLEEHVETLEKKEASDKHIYYTRLYIQRFLDYKNAKDLRVLTNDNILDFVAHLRKQKYLPSTINLHVRLIKAFAAFVGKPLRSRGLTLTETEEVKNPKRALSKEEFHQLIHYLETPDTKFHGGLEPEDRKWLYILGVATGYRVGELASLSPESFRLTEDAPVVVCHASTTKNSKNSLQAIPKGLVPSLEGWLSGKVKGRSVFEGVSVTHAAEMIQRDCRDAGIDSEGVVFHSTRVTYITNLLLSGQSIPIVKQLSRHSNINLTMNVYSRLPMSSKLDAVEASVPLPYSVPREVGKTVVPLTDTDVIDCRNPLKPEVLSGDGRLLTEPRETTCSSPRA